MINNDESETHYHAYGYISVQAVQRLPSLGMIQIASAGFPENKANNDARVQRLSQDLSRYSHGNV
jgi:hypothetical protein